MIKTRNYLIMLGLMSIGFSHSYAQDYDSQIEALQNEIAQLREELLEAQQSSANPQTPE